jgi:hypothetical protein
MAMPMEHDEKKSKQSLVDYVARFASYLPDLLELVGAPGHVARGVGHAVRLVPAMRKRAANGTDPAAAERFTSLLAEQQQLSERCSLLEQENTRMKYELAGATEQVQLLKTETQTLRTEMDSLRQRNFYLSLGVLAAILMAVSEFALRLVK